MCRWKWYFSQSNTSKPFERFDVMIAIKMILRGALLYTCVVGNGTSRNQIPYTNKPFERCDDSDDNDTEGLYTCVVGNGKDKTDVKDMYRYLAWLQSSQYCHHHSIFNLICILQKVSMQSPDQVENIDVL